ncbi:hypothetical protein FOZ60_010791 [Perkinsus olseni]|uniref:Uncharacterized protein n=1 Tax=Perkinsus olseni TaxID=32597 RepID=A0A7J6NEK3_PEROL|nr:hypothetical protein FOZ60_010791 [Perkinsus olseni]
MLIRTGVGHASAGEDAMSNRESNHSAVTLLGSCFVRTAVAPSASLKAAHTERPDSRVFSATQFATASKSSTPSSAASLRQPLSSPSMRFAILMVAATLMATFGLKVDASPRKLNWGGCPPTCPPGYHCGCERHGCRCE